MSTGSGPLQRPSATSKSAASAVEPHGLPPKSPKTIKLPVPFNVPADPEAAAARIIKNLGILCYYYTAFVWLVLSISLISRRKLSLILLSVVADVAVHYLLLRRAFPKLTVLKIMDERLVLPFLAIVAIVVLLLTRAVLHLLVTVAATLPIIFVHAAFWVTQGDGTATSTNAVGEEVVPLVDNEAGEDQSLVFSV